MDTNPVIDSMGRSWLAMYVESTDYGYIPAACVDSQWLSALKQPTIQYDYSLISATCDTNGSNIVPNLKLNTSIDLIFIASNYINKEYQYTYRFKLPKETYKGPGLALPLKFYAPVTLPYSFQTIWCLTDGSNTFGIVTIHLDCASTGATVTFKTQYYVQN